MFLRRVLPVALVVGWGLLLLAWAMGQAPFGAADEGDHYQRAVGISDGVFVGERPPPPADPKDPRSNWIYQTARVMPVPPGKAQLIGCYAHDASRSAICLDWQKTPQKRFNAVVNVGSYQVLPYLLPASVMGFADNPTDTLYLGRLASAFLVLLMLTLAVAVLRTPDGNPLALLGLFLAATPMVIFIGASLNGSGLEAASGIAFLAALLSLGRKKRSPGWHWAVAGVSGSTLALSRSITPAWVLLIVLLFIALNGPRRSWQLLKSGGYTAAAASAAVAIAIVLNRVWEATYSYNNVPFSFDNPPSLFLSEGWSVLIEVSHQFVGRFGYLEVGPPRAVTWAWIFAIAIFAVIALYASRPREKVVLVATIFVALAVPIVLFEGLIRNTGFGLQGRHLLAIFAAIPLLSGELIYRRRVMLSRRLKQGMVIVIPLLAGAVQLLSWWIVARRDAVGVNGPFNFLGSAEWSPPVGWGLWALLAIVGSVLVAAYGFMAIRKGESKEQSLGGDAKPASLPS